MRKQVAVTFGRAGLGKCGLAMGNSKCKGPEVGKDLAYLGNSSEVEGRRTRNRVI